MRADVFCNDNPIGTIDWTPDACGVQVNLDCAVCGRRERRGARRGGKKEGTPAVSLPLWTPTFPLLPNLAQIAYM